MLEPTPQYPVRVNGLDFTLSKPRVPVRLILRKAYDKGAFPSGTSWRDLVLIGMEAGKQLYQNNWVDLEKEYVFLTISDATATVATEEYENECQVLGFCTYE